MKDQLVLGMAYPVSIVSPAAPIPCTWTDMSSSIKTRAGNSRPILQWPTPLGGVDESVDARAIACLLEERRLS
jgi:hypothetical protein